MSQSQIGTSGAEVNTAIICVNCGAEYGPESTDCMRCGATIRRGEPYRWSRQTLRFIGTIGWTHASLELRFRGWSDVQGKLLLDGELSTLDVSGRLDGPTNTTLTLVFLSHDHALARANLNGRFDGVSFQGHLLALDDAIVSRFDFVTDSTTSDAEAYGATEAMRKLPGDGWIGRASLNVRAEWMAKLRSDGWPVLIAASTPWLLAWAGVIPGRELPRVFAVMMTALLWGKWLMARDRLNKVLNSGPQGLKEYERKTATRLTWSDIVAVFGGVMMLLWLVDAVE
jgi:ribosomal protein L40E